MRVRTTLAAVSAAALIVAGMTAVQAQTPEIVDEDDWAEFLQEIADGDPMPGGAPSIGRGWPQYGYGGPGVGVRNGPTEFGVTPEGISPLPVDVFISNDYYLDAEYFTDPRYFRCNSTYDASWVWGANGPTRLDDSASNPPDTADWGDCAVGAPVESIFSPYPFATAQEHYEALLAETTANGGPTIYTHDDPPPDWGGQWNRDTSPGAGAPDDYDGVDWLAGRDVYASAVMETLTPDYQFRLAQQIYHQAHNNASHWPSQYCWPEGFLRTYAIAAVRDHHLYLGHDYMTLIAGTAVNQYQETFWNREFTLDDGAPRLGADVRRAFGEAIGFWDGDVAIIWRSNIQDWVVHSSIEFGSDIQTIEIWDPYYDPETAELEGLRRETIFYSPETFVAPVRVVQDLVNRVPHGVADPYNWKDCLPSIYAVPDETGHRRGSQVTAGQVISYLVPDWSGRPWAQLWASLETDMRTDLSPAAQAAAAAINVF